MNSVTGVNANNNPIGFKAKEPNRRAIHEFIDQTNDFARDYFHSFEEKSETAKSKSAALLGQKIKCSYLGKVIEQIQTKIEHIRPAKSEKNLVELTNDVYMDAYLTELKVRDPELYKAVLRRTAELKAALMTNMGFIKEFIKNIFKKSS